MKKLLKILLISVVVIFTLLVTVPFLFKDKIISSLKETVNTQINAQVDFGDIDISLIKQFPNLAVGLNNLSIINKAPFEGDTLLYADEISLKLSLKTLFKKEGDPYEIKSISVKNATSHIFVNSSGDASYDISTPDSTKVKKETSENQNRSKTSMKFSLKKYALENINLVYWDQTSNMKLTIDGLNHSGSGDFTTSVFNLDTKTRAKVSMAYDGTNYLDQTPVSLDAIIGMDLNTNTYTFLKNKFEINRLELHFDGALKLLDKGQSYDLKFNTPSTDFLSFLEMIPEKYTKSLDGITTRGMFSMNGKIKGILTNQHIPSFKIDMLAKDAMFKYPSLDQSVDDIQLEIHLNNTTGLLDDTTVNIPTLSFKIGGDVFSAKANITNLLKNTAIKSALEGRLNLSNLAKAYPVPSNEPLLGLLDIDIKADFNMEMVDTNQYEDANIQGKFMVSNLKYATDQIPHPVNITEAVINFTPKRIQLAKFDASLGKSNFNIDGSLDNLLGFVFRNEAIKGRFNLDSKLFKVDDFIDMNENTVSEASQKINPDKKETQTTSKNDNPTGIPTFLDCSFKVSIDKLIYDNLTLSHLLGNAIVKNQGIKLENLSFDIFEGKIIMNGTADTKGDAMSFDTRMNIEGLNVNKSFSQIEMLKKVAPISDAISGKFNSDLHFKGKLKEDYTPDNETLKGSMSLNLVDSGFDPKNSNLINALNQNLSFINLEKSNLNDLELNLEIKDAKVFVKPFKYKQDDIEGIVRGSYGFNQEIDCTIDAQLPAKYLGGDINNLLAQTKSPELINIKIPLGIGLTGKINRPKVYIDMENAMKTLQEKALNYAKKRAKEKVKDEAKNQIENLLDATFGEKKEKDSNQTENGKEESETIKQKAGKLINKLFEK